jgi:RNA-directed DNA polymerase
VKGISGIEGRGFSKKRMPIRNRLDRGSNFASIRKDADLLMVFYCMKGGKLLNVSISTISNQDKKLTDAHLFQKWKRINWYHVEKSVNKLQTRITKAVLQNKWNLVKRLQYLLTHSYHAKLRSCPQIIDLVLYIFWIYYYWGNWNHF